jgi:DNA-directed RNA polymerase specialized sigma24 family protein
VREKVGTVVDEPKVIPLHDLDGADAAREAASFEEFFALERDRLFSVLALMTGDRSEAEEIAQDAFVAVWDRWDRVRLMDSPEAYLQRTAVNIFRKRYRRMRFLGGLITSWGPTSSGAPDAAVMLSEALRAVTSRQRAALVLTELLGYSADEAAEALGVKASTIGPVPDEDHVMVLGEAARLRERHVRDAGIAFEVEDRLRGLIGLRPDARHRQRDQPRSRVGPVLGHHQRSAVGIVVIVLGRVGAGVEDQVPGFRAIRHGDRFVARAKTEVDQTRRQHRDDHEGDDPRGWEGWRGRVLMTTPFVRRPA